MIDLVERPLFPTPPDLDLVTAFKEHLAKTGQPETFPSISTMTPPADTTVRALAEKLDVNVTLRPDKDQAPCPICQVQRKWKRNGMLVWCEASQAIYCIGPNCADRLWTDGRLEAALNLMRREERVRANAESLRIFADNVDPMISWVDAHLGLAKRVSVRHSGLATQMPKFRKTLSQWTRGQSPALAGAPFLTGGWKLRASLESARQVFTDLKSRSSHDSARWSEDLAPSAAEEMLSKIGQARRQVELLHTSVEAMNAFVSAPTLARLSALSRDPNAPTPFTMTQTSTSVQFRSREEHWSGSTGHESLQPLPVVWRK